MKAKDRLVNKFGIQVEAQPQFINIVQNDKYLIINVRWIKKIEPLGKDVLITMIDEKLDPISLNIKEFVKLLPNVALIDAGL